MEIKQIARVAHEVNRAYCRALENDSQPVWEDASSWQRGSAYEGVLFYIRNPHAEPEDGHTDWMMKKGREGWVYGPIKDSTKKEHPGMVPFNALPVAQQAKDFIFRAVVHTMMVYLPADVLNP